MPTPPDPLSIFAAALDLPAPADRAAYLDAACGADAALRAEVAGLLAAHDRAGGFLGGPPPPPEGADATAVATPDVPTRDWEPGPGEPEPAPAGGLAGAVLGGRYVLVEPIGEGGMGSVWSARQTTPIKRLVAVKLIRPGMDSRQVLVRFEAERQALAVMDHPNIARVLDAGAAPDGRPFFVMELVKGVPITKFCDARRLTPRERLELFVPVCEAIQHAHQKGVIHRDIKPSNVLVALYDDRAVPKVIDFGVAKAAGGGLTEQTFHTAFGGVVGTPAYMAPEQAALNNLDVDTRADVYGLGALLYELLAGSPPFTRADLHQAGVLEILRVVREQDPPRPSDRLSTADALPGLAAARGTEPRRLTGLLRSDLDWVVMRALEKDRGRRYETASGFADDVRRYLAGEPVRAVPPSRLYRVRKFVRRNRGPVTAAAVLAAVLTAGAIGTAVGLVRVTRAEGVAVRKGEDSRKLAEVFQRVLSSAPPDAEDLPNYKVLQLLDDNEARLADDLNDLPAVEADLRTTIGRVYLNLDAADKAERQFQRALDLRRAALGPDDPLVAASLTDCARAILEQRQDDPRGGLVGAPDRQPDERRAVLTARAGRARELAWEAVGILSAPGREEGEELVRATVALALAGGRAVRDGKPGPGDASDTARRAKAMADRVAGGRPTAAAADAAVAVADLFPVHTPVALPHARAASREAVALCRAAYGPHHPVTARARLRSAWCEYTGGDFAAAEAEFREALNGFTRSYGTRFHIRTVEALNGLVRVLVEQFRDDEADALVRRYEGYWGRPDYTFPRGVYCLWARGWACMNRGDPADAEAFYRRAVEISRAGGRPEDVGDEERTLFDWAFVHFLLGRPQDAHEARRREVSAARAAGEDRDPADLTGTALMLRADTLLFYGEGLSDLRLARRLIDERGRLLAARHAYESPYRYQLRVMIYHRLLRADPAAAPEYDDLDELRRVVERYPFTGNLIFPRLLEQDLAEAADATGNAAEAEAVRRDAVGRAEQAWKGHPEVAARRVVLADFLTAHGRHAEAGVQLRLAYDFLTGHPQTANRSLVRRRAEVLDRLVRWAYLSFDPTAAAWRAERAKLPFEPVPPPRPVRP